MKKPEVFLRKLSSADAEAYRKIAWGESIHTYVSFMEARTVEEAERIIRSNTNTYERIYGIYRKVNNQLVGAMIVSWFEPEKEVIVHYFIGEKFRKRGFAREAILVLSSFISESTTWNHEKLVFEIRRTNYSSYMLQKSLGSHLAEETQRYWTFHYFLNRRD